MAAVIATAPTRASNPATNAFRLMLSSQIVGLFHRYQEFHFSTPAAAMPLLGVLPKCFSLIQANL